MDTGRWKNINKRNLTKKRKVSFGKHSVLKKLTNIWVCWGIDPKRREATLKKAAKAKIEIWEFKDMLKGLLDEIGTTHYGDDIIQSLSLVKAALKM